jgi:hypothetical protein
MTLEYHFRIIETNEKIFGTYIHSFSLQYIQDDGKVVDQFHLNFGMLVYDITYRIEDIIRRDNGMIWYPTYMKN